MKVQRYFALTSQKAERIFSVCFSSDCGFCAMIVPLTQITFLLIQFDILNSLQHVHFVVFVHKHILYI